MKPIFTPQPGDAYTNTESNDRLVYISEELGWVFSTASGAFIPLKDGSIHLDEPNWYLDVRAGKD